MSDDLRQRADEPAEHVGQAAARPAAPQERLPRAGQPLAADATDFRALVENTREVFVRYGLDLRITYVSPVISRWVALRPQDMVGGTNRDAGFAPDLADRFDDALRHTRDTLEPVTFEYGIQGLDGELVAESRVYPELGPGGVLTGLMSITHDITGRVHMEEALRENESKYRSVVERAHDAVLIIDTERCLFANGATARISGYAAGELEGLPITEVIPAAGRELLLDRARRRLAGEEMPSSYVTELLRKDRTPFAAEVSAGVITYEGRPANLLIVRDVTERERAAEALRRSEATRDTAERVAGVGSYRWDLGSERLECSPEMFRLFDVDPETFDGEFMTVVSTRVHPDDREGLLASVGEFRGSGRPRPLTYRIVRRDGATRVLHGEAFLEGGDGPARPAIVGYYRDVTEEHEALRALRDAEERSRSLFEESPVPLFELDASGLAHLLEDASDAARGAWAAGLAGAGTPHTGDIEGVRVVRANQAAVDLSAAAGEDELVAGFGRCLTAELLAELPVIMAGVASGARSFARRVPMLTLAGEPRVVDLHGSVLPGCEHTLERVLLSLTDVTEQVRADAQIRRLNEQLEERVASRTEQRDALNRELEAFAYSVSHDVRAPLRAIDGFSALVMQDAAGCLGADDVAHLTRVRDAAQRMGELIDDLLGLSRISRRELLRTRVDVTALALDVGAELREEEPARRVDLTVAPGMTAWADPALLRVVLRELLENAWKFTAGREPARVAVGVGGAQDGGPAFFVRDDGAGYDPRFSGHLFGAFQRVHPAGEFPGRGIGLATVQRLVARHGGSVWAEGSPGEGATFWFGLPGEPGRPHGEASP